MLTSGFLHGCTKSFINFSRFLAKPIIDWESEDFYERLGVKQDATQEEIQKKYREIAMAYHPDRIIDPKEKEEGTKIIANVNSAYDVLKDEQQRMEYDQQRNASPFPFYRRPPSVHRQNVRLSFVESCFGTTKSFIAIQHEPCSKCKGMGTDDGKRPETCYTCGGSGFIPQGLFPMPCPSCEGKGFTIQKPCKQCKGEGTTPKPSPVTVPIPAGVEHGSVLNYNTNAGIVVVMCVVEPDPLIKREGNDLHITIPLSVKTAMLGGIVRVPTLKGIVDKKVLPGTQPYDVEKLHGAGVDGKGDLYIHYRIIIPRYLKPADKKLVEDINNDFMKANDDLWNSSLSQFQSRLSKFKPMK